MCTTGPKRRGKRDFVAMMKVNVQCMCSCSTCVHTYTHMHTHMHTHFLFWQIYFAPISIGSTHSARPLLAVLLRSPPTFHRHLRACGRVHGNLSCEGKQWITPFIGPTTKLLSRIGYNTVPQGTALSATPTSPPHLHHLLLGTPSN